MGNRKNQEFKWLTFFNLLWKREKLIVRKRKVGNTVNLIGKAGL
jgi:hypothetical protein